jgi:renalase
MDLLVVGAGIAGLACAGRAAELGMRPLVLERSHGVGGRCATRRVEGQAVDHGLPFLHGSHPEFLRALDSVAATALLGWPERVRGRGTACHPAALSPRDLKRAFAEGLTAFPKHLRRGLDVRLQTRVEGLDLTGERPVLHLAGGDRLTAQRVVLALACEQATALLRDVLSDAGAEVAAMGRLLAMIGTVPCCTVLAGYPLEVEAPPWDVWYPEDSKVVQVLSHDSSKRVGPRFRVLVLQAHARWSRARTEVAPASWTEELLAEAARLAGDWAGRPLWVQAHLWRHGRLDPDGELALPVSIPLGKGARLGLAGELFHPGGGAQAAYLSGRALADRLAGEEAA